MQLHNLQLLLRPTTGGLPNHHNFISSQADQSLRSELFSDLILFTPDGPVSCHQSLLVPLSPLLNSLISSYPSYPGLVHTVLTPINLHTVKNILQIVYTGKVSVRCRQDMQLVLAGLQVLGIHLPGLECYQADVHTVTARGPEGLASTSQALDFSMPWGRRCVEENMNNLLNNNSIPLPFSTPLLPQSNTSLLGSIVQLSRKVPDSKPLLPVNLQPPPLSLIELQTQLASQLLPLAIDESVQCNVVGCRSLVTLRGLSAHFKSHPVGFEAFKCDVCNKRFKDKKAVEIHRIEDHQCKENTMSSKEDSRNVKAEPIKDVDKKDIVIGNGRKRKRSKSGSYWENNKNTDYENIDNTDNHTEDIDEVLQSPMVCALCQVPLLSEWYRHPRRHKCPHASPKQGLLSSPQLICPLCDTAVASSWHKPPSRHACPAVSISKTPDLPAGSGNVHASSTSSTKYLACTKKRARSASRQPSSRKQSLFSCQICPESFISLLCLRTHYTVSHYWDRVTDQFSSWGTHCYICLQAFPSTNQLIRHMGNFHSYVDQCLVQDELHFISVETTIKLLSLECGLCGVVKATSAELKNHLSYVHYSKELEREFPGDHAGHKNKRCDRCGKIFHNNGSARIRHIGSFHDQVLKYAKEFITVDAVDMNYIPDNNFESDNNNNGEPFEDQDLSLLAKWEPLVIPKPALLPTSPSMTDKPKQRNISKSSRTPESSEPEVHPCPVTDCSRQCNSRNKLLVHLTMTHYLEELEIKFGTGCGVSQCIECDLMLPSNKLGYIKHMAVEHEMVMTFVKRDLALDKTLKVEGISKIPQPGEDEVQSAAEDNKDDSQSDEASLMTLVTKV